MDRDLDSIVTVQKLDGITGTYRKITERIQTTIIIEIITDYAGGYNIGGWDGKFISALKTELRKRKKSGEKIE